MNASKGKKEKRSILENSRLVSKVELEKLPTTSVSKISQLNNTLGKSLTLHSCRTTYITGSWI